MNTIQHSTINLVSGFEGFSATPYKDVRNIFSIGYGFTTLNSNPVTSITPEMTQDQANIILAEKLQSFADGVNQLVKVILNQNQFDALCSFSYNLGLGALRLSALLENINGNKTVTLQNFTDWDNIREDGVLVKNAGLLVRRTKEFEIFNQK